MLPLWKPFSASYRCATLAQLNRLILNCLITVSHNVCCIVLFTNFPFSESQFIIFKKLIDSSVWLGPIAVLNMREGDTV